MSKYTEPCPVLTTNPSETFIFRAVVPGRVQLHISEWAALMLFENREIPSVETILVKTFEFNDL